MRAAESPPGTTRLYLPGGGSFDLPLPGSGPSFALAREATPSCPIVWPILGGLAVGAVITWLVVRNP